MRPRSATAPTARATLHIQSAYGVLFVKVDILGLRDGSEHALVNGKQKIRNPRTPNRWGCQDVFETQILEITDVLASCVRKG